MIVERHIFGSVTGYRTLACSPGISNQEGRHLEAFSFGQPSSQAFVESLIRNPAYWIRPLGTRRVLSRLVPGAPDEQGRTTMLMHSAVVSATDWDGVLWGDAGLLLRTSELWKWDGSARLAPLDLSVASPGRIATGRGRAPVLLNLISLIERAAGRPISLVVREADLGPEEARCLIMLIPPSARGRFSLAYRSLNSRLGATVNCVAAEAAIDANSAVVNPYEDVPLTTYAQVLEEAGIRKGAVDCSTVATYVGLGQYESRIARSPANQPVIVVEGPAGNSWLARYAGWALSAVLAVAVAVLAWLLLTRSPADHGEGSGGFNAGATVPVSEGQPILSSELTTELHDLMKAMPLPRQAARREQVVAVLERMVRTAGGAPDTAAKLSADLDQIRQWDNVMSAFELSMQSANTNGLKSANAQLSAEYPHELASLGRRRELRDQLTAQLVALGHPVDAKPLTENALIELDRLLARYAEQCPPHDSSVRVHANDLTKLRTRLVNSRLELEKATLELLKTLVGFDCPEDRLHAIEVAQTAESTALDADGVKAICRQAVVMAAEKKWCGADAESLGRIIDKRVPDYLRQLADRLRKIANDEANNKKDGLVDSLMSIVEELEQAIACPRQITPEPMSETGGNDGTREKQ